MTWIVIRYFGGNYLAAFGVFAYILCISVSLYSHVVILFLEKKFIRYIERFHPQIKEDYDNFYRGGWMKILRFIRLSKGIDDEHLRLLYKDISFHESVRGWALLMCVVVFFSLFICIASGVIK